MVVVELLLLLLLLWLFLLLLLRCYNHSSNSTWDCDAVRTPPATS